MSDEQVKKCGYVALVGRPNVGKSTLLNSILGQKLVITSRKPQTTRHQILGIHTTGKAQFIFVDTPGLHTNYDNKAINRYMNRVATNAIQFVDVVIWLIEGRWTAADEAILPLLPKPGSVPVILAMNKVDLVKNRGELLPLMQEVGAKYPFEQIIPISAKHSTQLDVLQKEVARYLPESDFFFAEDQITDRTERFLVSEVVREKLMRFLGQELPYSVTVEVDLFTETEKGGLNIAATIFVERKSQKRIVIGNKGDKLKQIGTEARLTLQKMFQAKIFLELWVKVKTGWADDDRALKSLGYRDS